MIAIGRAPQKSEASLSERRPLLDGGGDVGLVAESDRALEREGERGEAKREREDRRSVDQMRNEIGSEQRERREAGGAQIELGTLENAPDTEPSPLAARRSERDAERDDGERESGAGEQGVTGPNRPTQTCREPGVELACSERERDHGREEPQREHAEREAAAEVRRRSSHGGLGPMRDRGGPEGEADGDRREHAREPGALAVIGAIESLPEFLRRAGAIRFEQKRADTDERAEHERDGSDEPRVDARQREIAGPVCPIDRGPRESRVEDRAERPGERPAGDGKRESPRKPAHAVRRNFFAADARRGVEGCGSGRSLHVAETLPQPYEAVSHYPMPR